MGIDIRSMIFGNKSSIGMDLCLLEIKLSTSECPKTIAFLPSEIPEPMSCYIPDYCTGIECCAEIPALGLGLHVFAFLDLNKLELQIGMENVSETIKLNDYVWGEVKTLMVAGGLIKLL